MANWSTMKKSILIGSLSGPNFAIRTATAYELISPNRNIFPYACLADNFG